MTCRAWLLGMFFPLFEIGVEFFGAAREICFPHLISDQADETEFVFTTPFHPSSPQEVFVRIVPFHFIFSVLQFMWLFRWCYPLLAFIFAQTSNCLTWNMWTTLHLRSFRFAYMAGLVRSQIFLWHGNNGVRESNFVALVVISHLVAVYQMNCLHPYRRPDWHSSVWGVFDITVASRYRSEVSVHTHQPFRRFYCTVLGHSLDADVRRVSVFDRRCLLIVLVEFVERILSVTQKLAVR